MLHSPTRFFISIEYKEERVEGILRAGWHAWERDHRAADDKPIEVLVGGTAVLVLVGGTGVLVLVGVGVGGTGVGVEVGPEAVGVLVGVAVAPPV